MIVAMPHTATYATPQALGVGGVWVWLSSSGSPSVLTITDTADSYALTAPEADTYALVAPNPESYALVAPDADTYAP